jgi:hypothetical protein
MTVAICVASALILAGIVGTSAMSRALEEHDSRGPFARTRGQEERIKAEDRSEDTLPRRRKSARAAAEVTR